MVYPSHGVLDASDLTFDSQGKLIYEKIMVNSLKRQAYGLILYTWIAMESVPEPNLILHTHTLTSLVPSIYMAIVLGWRRFWIQHISLYIKNILTLRGDTKVIVSWSSLISLRSVPVEVFVTRSSPI